MRRIVPDRRLRIEQNGTTLLGGHPFRVIRLSRNGAALVASWFGGEAERSPQTPEERSLADRLIAADMAHPVRAPSSADYHVVIPFHGDVGELQATLSSLREERPASITVVDDGNAPPVSSIDGATVIRSDRQRGPAAARNRGWRHLVDQVGLGSADSIVFIDAGVRLDVGRLATLIAHTEDESGLIGAAAPRVASLPGTSVVDRYESMFSPLDLGPDPATVGPGRRITYAPTACLAVSVSALVENDGFDETLRYGEDVDFVWRLSAKKSVRYEPSVVMRHPPRPSLLALAEQRMRYASAAAPLAKRHPDAAHPWQATWVGAATVAAATLGRPLFAVALAVVPIRSLAQRLETTATPLPTAIRLVAVGNGWTIRSFAEATVRSWFVPLLPLAVAGLRPVGAWMAAGWARRMLATRDPGALAVGVIDDAAYGIGVAVGAWHERSLRAFRPKVTGADVSRSS